MRKRSNACSEHRRQWLMGAGIGSLLLPIAACDASLFGGSDDDLTATQAAAKAKRSAEERDVALLNAGILLEQTAILAYTVAAGLPFIVEDATVLAVAKLFMGQHEEHRDTLIKLVATLGGTPADPATAPPLDVPPAILDENATAEARKFATLTFARGLERQAADTYFQLVVAQLQTELARRSATEILPVEAQHVAIFDLVLGAAKPVNAAFFSEQG